MTFMYHNKIPVSMLISKDDLKVRIQSPDFSSLWYVLTELVRRVSDLYSSGKFDKDPFTSIRSLLTLIHPPIDESFEIQFTEAIPLNELFSAIDEHYQYRAEIAKLKKVLEDRSYQFRVIQKRLLNRFKVRSMINY
jgi:Bardet-Biedl syndrome 9 protein